MLWRTALGALVCIGICHSAGSQELHWYRGNTHTHTSAPPGSDADGAPRLVASWYKDHGYQFLVITDHEYLTDVRPLNQQYGQDGKFLLIPGQEITQVVTDSHHPGGVRHAHVNGIGAKQVILPIGPLPGSPEQAKVDELSRQIDALHAPGSDELISLVQEYLVALGARGVSMAETYNRNVASIRAQGALPQVNHPNLQWSVTKADLRELQGPYLFEVWNGYPSSNNLGGVDESGREGVSAEALWDALLSEGKIVWAVGADDAHAYHQFDNPQSPGPGRAWVVVRAATLTRDAITSALTEGHFYASTGISLATYEADEHGISIGIEDLPDWSPALKRTTRYATRFIGANGKLLAEVHGRSPVYHFRGTEQYVRASILDSDGRRAWTQPIFRDRRKSVQSLPRG